METPNPNCAAQQISLFRSRIESRSFDEATLRILELILVSKDVESSIGVRSAVKQFLRDESILIFRDIAEKSVEIKLLCSDFLIRLFAVIGDVESCLALRYEALVMRDEKRTTYPELHVSFKEWLTFAEHTFENGFPSIAEKACQKALNRTKGNYVADHEIDDSFQDVHIKKIKTLKDASQVSISSRSVQSQAEAYLKQKDIEQSTQQLADSIETQSSGSSRFKDGIRTRNLRRLRDYQCLSFLS